MKNSASIFFKHIISMLCSIAKSKSMAIRSKTNAVKARLIVLSLLKNKKLSLASISHKLHAILEQQDKGDNDDDDHHNQSKVVSLFKNKKLSLASISHKIHAILGKQDKAGEDDQSKAIVVYNALTNEPAGSSSSTVEHGGDDHYAYGYDEYDDKYPDLTHSLFEEDEMDLGDPNGSVIDLVRNSKEEGEDFRLEDEIDQVADLFILKFHKRIRLQKLESFKRYQDMLERST